MRHGGMMSSCVGVLALAACAAPVGEAPVNAATVGEARVTAAPAAAAMAPTPYPHIVEGERWILLDHVTGAEKTVTIERIDADGSISGKGSDGCTFVRRGVAGSRPIEAWEDCPSPDPQWRSGSSTITDHEGALFPLQVGNTETWSFTSRASNGETAEIKRTCTVAGTESIATRSGHQDAYRITCNTRGAELLYLVGADGRELRSVRTDKKRGTEWDLETIRVELPAS